MADQPISIAVRAPSDGIAILDIAGDISSFAENELMDAYTTATNGGASTLLLNFADMDYMNSSGIGLLVTLLVRAQRRGQRLGAFGLDDHYRQIFDLTRLNEAIAVHDDEAAAMAAAR